MSNFPLSYALAWLPRLLLPSLAGGRQGFAPPQGEWMRPPPRRSVRLAFVGDISAVAGPEPPRCDAALGALLASADLVVGTCESPVVERPRRRLGTALGTRHAMTAGFLRGALAAAGVDPARLVLSVANNHALDQGAEGFGETLAAFDRLGIRAVGLAGEPLACVRAGALTVGIAAFTLWRNAKAGDFAGRVAMDAKAAGWQGEAMRGCDLVCALPHWDWEFRHFPRPATQGLARRLAGVGAGLVVGGHAHVLQPLERIGDTLVAYGLGDFLGTAWARQPWPGRIGAVLTVEVGLDGEARGRVAGYRLHPFFRLRERRRERLVPVEALDGELRDRVVDRIGRVFSSPSPVRRRSA